MYLERKKKGLVLFGAGIIVRQISLLCQEPGHKYGMPAFWLDSLPPYSQNVILLRIF